MEFVFSLGKEQRIFIGFLSQVTDTNLPNLRTNWQTGCIALLFLFHSFLLHMSNLSCKMLFIQSIYPFDSHYMNLKRWAGP